VLYILNNKEKIESFLDKSLTFFKTEKNSFYEKLMKISQITLFQSTTFFILIRINKDIKANKVYDYFLKDKILLRDCSNFIGLPNNYLRISLQTSKLNSLATDKFIEFFT
jgi:threonine-phosphate decarboxylase